MDLWIAVTLSASVFQTLRFLLHKVLNMGGLSTTGSTFARFAFAAPGALVLVGLYLWAQGISPPVLGGAFWAYAMAGALGQILATNCVVALFHQRNFAVGITFKKTEVIQTALVAALILGERISLGGWIAIAVGLLGVLLLSDAGQIGMSFWRRIGNRAVALGLASGFFFAISAVGYRAASLQIDHADPLVRAGVTLVCVTMAQTIFMALWLRLREPGQIRAVWAARRMALWLGLTSMAGSLCWFTAYTLQKAAYVQALGQVELIFSLFVSVLFFRETISRRELLGIAFITLSVLALIVVIEP
ncbi:hypothetical protein P775_10060 [Puniceibacterium antarcticum]|uniref:EamA domain-containing protein n=1 Tax=Puniceibacterium antarcticum TaxID=1206336 RepID=A0A2G8RFD1_9RHOB|nr:DMT family transporter [Puniceibacterium antarcticum]PIL20285.1 hypothetical protein P775_10060 [Puniceibacterium antarcticum]